MSCFPFIIHSLAMLLSKFFCFYRFSKREIDITAYEDPRTGPKFLDPTISNEDTYIQFLEN